MSFQEVGTVEELEEAISDGQSIVVFSKDQCPACVSMDNWLNQKYNTESGLKIIKAKLEKIGRSVVADFGLRTMPTTLLFKGGEEVYRVAGFVSPQPVENAIGTHLSIA